jgi:DNA-binding MarR family transcriptional regulator
MQHKPKTGYDWMHAALNQRQDDDEIIIPLPCIAVMSVIEHMGGGNERTISVRKLAADHGLDRGTVKRAVDALVENKFLVNPRPGPNRTIRYTLNIPFDIEGN